MRNEQRLADLWALSRDGDALETIVKGRGPDAAAADFARAAFQAGASREEVAALINTGVEAYRGHTDGKTIKASVERWGKDTSYTGKILSNQAALEAGARLFRDKGISPEPGKSALETMLPYLAKLREAANGRPELGKAPLTDQEIVTRTAERLGMRPADVATLMDSVETAGTKDALIERRAKADEYVPKVAKADPGDHVLIASKYADDRRAVIAARMDEIDAKGGGDRERPRPVYSERELTLRTAADVIFDGKAKEPGAYVAGTSEVAERLQATHGRETAPDKSEWREAMEAKWDELHGQDDNRPAEEG